MTDAHSLIIMVVDDNPATRYSTSRILRSAGFQVIEAETGQQALALAAKRPDVVVLDVHLPDIDGFSVCRELRGFPETVRTPVIHLSATFVTDIDKVRGLESGADGYLTHPVEPIVLVATVNAFLRARRAEEEMRKSEVKFRAIFDHAQNGICLFTQEFEFLEANPSICSMLKRSREELLGQNLQTFLPGTAGDQLARITEQLGKEGAWRGTLPLLNSSDQSVEIDWHLTAHSVPGIWLAILTDARERIRIEEEREQLLASERAARAQAERANRLKDDFLATLSHELRTPLSAIIGWTQVLKLGKAISEQDLSDGIGAIERNAKIQAQLIEDLLDVSRITSGKLRLDIEAVDVATVADAALESLMPAISAKEVVIARDFEANAGIVAADPGRLQQVIWNLVSNAVKFSPRKGRIDIRVRRFDSSVELSVRDAGQGISSEFLPHIFGRFRQEDASTTRNYGGLGLGLAIVKHLVEMHGGTVQALSRGIDQGAEFIIRLPITAIRQTTSSPAENKTKTHRILTSNYHSAGEIAGIKILVVDDDDDTRVLLHRLLSDCGADVTAVCNVSEALEALPHVRPEVLVSDIGMPNQSGYDLIRQIRQLGPEFEHLPAIALTAFARSSDRENAFTAGFQLYLQKPVDPSELVGSITSVLRPAEGSP